MTIYYDKNPTVVYEWLNDIINQKYKEKLTLTMYDGCGTTLDQFEFYVENVIEQSIDLDYADSDTLNVNVALTFSRYNRVNTNINYTWMFSFQDEKGCKIERNVNVEQHPSITIDAITIDHLNGKITLPGKAHWHELIISPIDLNEKWHLMVSPGEQQLTLYNNDTPIERWTFFSNIVNVENNSLIINYSNIKYDAILTPPQRS